MTRLLVGLFFVIGAAFCSDDVLDLTDSNFKDGVAGKDIMLVEFFAPWCGHCKRLAPEYETAATALLKNDPPVSLAKVDCVGEGKDTCSKYGVSGYPTLKIFRGGEMSSDYDGPRDSDGIVKYMKSNAGPSSTELKDVSHLDSKLESSEDLLIVGFFSGENEVSKHFQKAADKKRTDFNFAHSMNSEINEKYGHNDVVVLFRPKHLHAKFEAQHEVLSSAASVDDILNFIDEKQLGMVGQITQSNEAILKKPSVIAYYRVDWKRNHKGSRYYRNRVARIAKKFIAQINFAIAAKSDFSRQISDWGFKDDDEVKVAARNAKGEVFLMTDDFSVDNLEKFVNEFKDNKLEPYIKSEDIPENNDGPVKVVVGKNFNEIVNDPTKDVLIEFYAPWCGHCKTLEPKFNELGENLKDIKDVVIAKMDATANDVPQPFEVQGFPTLYWAPMGNKENPKKYQGGREVSDFTEFIKKEATNPVEFPKKKKSKKEKEL